VREQIIKLLGTSKEMLDVAIRNTCGECTTELDDMIVSAEQTLSQLTAKLAAVAELNEQSEDQLKLHKVYFLSILLQFWSCIQI
jgi:flavin-binding protein dodecin